MKLWIGVFAAGVAGLTAAPADANGQSSGCPECYRTPSSNAPGYQGRGAYGHGGRHPGPDRGDHVRSYEDGRHAACHAADARAYAGGSYRSCQTAWPDYRAEQHVAGQWESRGRHGADCRCQSCMMSPPWVTRSVSSFYSHEAYSTGYGDQHGRAPVSVAPPVIYSAPPVYVRQAPVHIQPPPVYVEGPVIYVDAPEVHVGPARIEYAPPVHVRQAPIEIQPSPVVVAGPEIEVATPEVHIGSATVVAAPAAVIESPAVHLEPAPVHVTPLEDQTAPPLDYYGDEPPPGAPALAPPPLRQRYRQEPGERG